MNLENQEAYVYWSWPGENCAPQSVNECDLFLQTNLG